MINQTGLLLLVAIIIAIGVLLYLRNQDKNNQVRGFDPEDENNGLLGVPDEKNSVIEKEYRTGQFSKNFENDMDRSGVYKIV